MNSVIHILLAEGGWREMSYIQQDNENGENANEDAMEVIDRYYLDGLKKKKLTLKQHVKEQKEN